MPIILGREPQKIMPRLMSGGSRLPSEDTCKVRKMWVPIIGMEMEWRKTTAGLLSGTKWQDSKEMHRHNSPQAGSI